MDLSVMTTSHLNEKKSYGDPIVVITLEIILSWAYNVHAICTIGWFSRAFGTRLAGGST